MTETVDVFYQQTNYVTLLIFWLLIDVRFLLLHASFIFDCLVYFFHYSVLRVRFYNKYIINIYCSAWRLIHTFLLLYFCFIVCVYLVYEFHYK